MRKRMLTVIIILCALVFLWVYFSRVNSLSQYDYLLDPKISTRPNQTMLVTEATGTPTQAAQQAMPPLFKSFFALKSKVKSMKMSAPRARWPKPVDTPKDQWLGVFGLSIPNTVEALPKKIRDDYGAKIEVWEYGTVAEILHVGPYSEETPTIEKLHQFIIAQGYQIIGPHEEEYLKGPGMFLKGNPKHYHTIIRYRIGKMKSK